MNRGIHANPLFLLPLALFYLFLVILGSPIILGYLYLKLAQKWHKFPCANKPGGLEIAAMSPHGFIPLLAECEGGDWK